MTAKTHDLPSTHEQVALLLPWYVNGTLEGAEYAEVHRHLGACLVCRRDLQRLRGLARLAATAHTIDLSGSASKARFFRTLPPRPRRWYQRALAGRQLVPGRPLLAFAAVLLLLAVTPLALHGWYSEGQPAFYTLASKGANAERQPPADLRLVFGNNLSRERIDALSLGLDAEVVGGPSSMGVYNVRLKKQPASPQAVEAALADWRNRPEVVFAEPSRRP